MYINFSFSLKILFFVKTISSIDCLELFSSDPDIDKNATQLIESRGFLSQTHYVLTKDGYVLQLFRIVNPHRFGRSKLYPVYLQYGFMGNTDQWLIGAHGMLSPNGTYAEDNGIVNNCLSADSVAISLPFVLSTCGYDVWIGNLRGSEYTSHIHLNPLEIQYWSFSVDHYTKYDLTALLQYILSLTKSETIGYIGFSLGNAVMYQLLSSEPKYNEIIKPFISMGSFVHLQHVRSPIIRLFDFFLPILRIGGLGPLRPLFGRYFCGNSLLKTICSNIFFLLGGFDPANINPAVMPRLFAHFPDMTSSTVGAHIGQRIRFGTFSHYDYGLMKNMEIYGQSLAPIYNISNIKCKYIVLISGQNDFLSDQTDDNILRNELRVPLYADYVIPYEFFSHGDFLYGNNAGLFVNAPILRVMASLDLTSIS